MIKRAIPISEVQSKITHLPEQFAEDPGTVIVTSQGKPVMAVLPYEEYKWLLEKLDSLLETLEIVQDEGLMTVFRESVEALERGETVTWEDLKKELELRETREIMQDEELMASFREGVQELAEGKGIPWEDVKKELGWNEMASDHPSQGTEITGSHQR